MAGTDTVTPASMRVGIGGWGLQTTALSGRNCLYGHRYENFITLANIYLVNTRLDNVHTPKLSDTLKFANTVEH
jgi:hypothetical protein